MAVYNEPKFKHNFVGFPPQPKITLGNQSLTATEMENRYQVTIFGDETVPGNGCD